MTTALVKLAERNKWKWISSAWKDNPFTQQYSPYEIKTWEVYKTHKHHKQFRFLCIW